MLAGSLDYLSLGTEIPYSVHCAKLDSIGSAELSRTPEGAPTRPPAYPTPVPRPKVLPLSPTTSPPFPTHPIATLGALYGSHSRSVPLIRTRKPRPFCRHAGTAPVHAHAVLFTQVPLTPCLVLDLSSPHPPTPVARPSSRPAFRPCPHPASAAASPRPAVSLAPSSSSVPPQAHAQIP